VAGKVRCIESEFTGEVPVPAGKKECYCRHRNPHFLDEQVQFHWKMDEKMLKEKGKRGANGLSIELKKAKVMFTTF
jgi:hypothetical protein